MTTSTGEFVPAENGQISSNGLYFTDKDGKITINGVVGTLVVTETATIPGYTIDEATRTQTVVVNPNDTQTLHFTNTPSTTLVIEKYIEGTTTPLKGVTFLVTDSSGAVVGNSNGEFITDENGRIVLNDLTPGTTVTAREVKALEGYVLDGQPKSILIKSGEVQTLRFYNAKQGTIVVKKLDKQTGEPLAGVEFQITYSDGSYLDDDYGHLSSKGLYKTDANGEIRISGVVGTLVITETNLEIMELYADRLKGQVAALQAQRKTLHIPLELLGREHCFPLNDSDDITGKVVAVKPTSLRYEYQRADCQLILVTNGSGARGYSRGTSVYGVNVFTGRRDGRWERRDVLGEVRPECMPQWAKEHLSVIQRERALEQGRDSR